MVTAATIYMSLLGPAGLKRVAQHSHANTASLVQKLEKIPGVEKAFSSPFFHEAALKLSKPAHEVLATLKSKGILAGLELQTFYPELEDTLLVCATETKTADDIQNYATQFELACK